MPAQEEKRAMPKNLIPTSPKGGAPASPKPRPKNGGAIPAVDEKSLDAAIADSVAEAAWTVLEKLDEEEIRLIAHRHIEESLRNGIEVMLANDVGIHF
jgi:chitodextrinase